MEPFGQRRTFDLAQLAGPEITFPDVIVVSTRALLGLRDPSNACRQLWQTPPFQNFKDRSVSPAVASHVALDLAFSVRHGAFT